jgi:hypothetical protein
VPIAIAKAGAGERGMRRGQYQQRHPHTAASENRLSWARVFSASAKAMERGRRAVFTGYKVREESKEMCMLRRNARLPVCIYECTAKN